MITVCVPMFDPHPKFLPHFIEFYAANKIKHDLVLSWSHRRPLHHAQAHAVQMAKNTGSTHVLFVEDDHWGFPVDGVDALIAEDKPVIGFHSCYRVPPYFSNCCRLINPEVGFLHPETPNLLPFERVGSDPLVQPCDLITWAMTLVKTEVFSQLSGDPFEFWGKVPGDSAFSQMCHDAGIPRFVHFGASLPHGDVVPEMRGILNKVEEYKKGLLFPPNTMIEEMR